MLYINQLNHFDIPYYHNADHGGPAEGRACVGTSGCGLCSLCMIVDHMTDKTLSLEDCVKLSEEKGANREVGTNMKILAPIVAEMFGLELTTTNFLDELKKHLASGGEAIANVAEDKENGHIGLFTHNGHYIVVLSIDGDDACLLDPSYKEGKFDEEGRQGKVNYDNAPFLYCDTKYLMEDAASRNPGFYIFKRKK